ncbi:binding-protein-dependent transport systems inner membrane component [Beutenbergia cavernae DSM 12333]|uniref:Binding-protein-dependent transport systems inner membrane component n=1 Tax=Beutenbergia cavernae (strain ATCC BAA-8 / DSM 12333 / CCUG 43141 / JCM 11478 / NBRC 16432 / NCIMB 13614 / HKI 0122) TaxID=471853 RepID=C5BYW9_BEUC1|nr:carbohydrate ABC transporter permease [Beutenbergia cavernae]ACQ81084.1 binding-protein-dependent transport systems inner membrane component [Beutenbergia cavernae DSM 12333]
MTSLPVIAQTAGPGAARWAGRRRGRRTGGTNRRPGWLTYAILVVVILGSAYPLYYTIQLGSSDAVTIAQEPIPQLLPQGNFFDNVATLFDGTIPWGRAFLNSVVISTAAALSVVAFSTLAGYSFAKLRYKGRGPLLVFVIATMAVPTQLGIVPMFILFTELGINNNILGVIIPAMVSAFGVFWMTQYLEQALPYELIEAARVDGASMIRTFWHVALPAARPAAAMLGLFTFVTHWTAFFWPFIILTSANPTLPMAVQLLQANYFTDYSLVMAGVLLTTVPLLVLFIVAGKQLVSGIMQGAVKG